MYTYVLGTILLGAGIEYYTRGGKSRSQPTYTEYLLYD